MIKYLGISIAVAVLAITAGCGQTRPKPVDVETADAVIKSVLDKWQAGQTIDDLRQQKDSIVVQENYWAGYKLNSYRIIKSTPRDSNLIVEVELELQDKTNDSDAISRVREYIVSTHPAKTVFRNLMN